MKTNVECLVCLLKQTMRVGQICNCDEYSLIASVKAVSALLSKMDMSKSPPENALFVYSAIGAATGVEDPYFKLKKESNAQALKLLASLRLEVQNSEEPLLTATRFAIAGNIIDYGAMSNPDINKALARSRALVPAINHSRLFLKRVDNLKKGARILYLADNCGEIVYDTLLLEYLHKHSFDITVAVKDGPIINDALIEDAYEAGLDKYARIITNGTRCPGTVLGLCSIEFLEIFDNADLIISKGQGNFESLSEVDREIAFLLTVKCRVAANHLASITGTEPDDLPGQGEMAIYCSSAVI